MFPWRLQRNSVGELRLKRLHLYDDRRGTRLPFKLPFSHHKQQQKKKRAALQDQDVVWWLNN